MLISRLVLALMLSGLGLSSPTFATGAKPPAPSKTEVFCLDRLKSPANALPVVSAELAKYLQILAQLTPGHAGTGVLSGLKVVTAAFELGEVEGLVTTTGKPLNLSAGGLGMVLTDMTRSYPRLLAHQGGGEFVVLGMLMDKISTHGMIAGLPVEVTVDGMPTPIKTWQFQSRSGARYVFLDHPWFKKFSAVPETGQSLYTFKSDDWSDSSSEEQKVWSIFNQGLAEVFAREKGDIFLPHDSHVAPASFYIHRRGGSQPISVKPLVHNERYVGGFHFSWQSMRKEELIWNVSDQDLRHYFTFRDGLDVSMLAPALRVAEENEVFSALSVSDGSAQQINSGASTGDLDFFGRVGGLLNGFGSENRPDQSVLVRPASPEEIIADGISNPDIVQEFSKNGFAFGRKGWTNDQNLAAKARAKKAIQINFKMSVDSRAPLFVGFARMVHQKGLSFVLSNIEHILNDGGQVIVGGPVGDATGEWEHDHFLALQERLQREHHPHVSNFVFVPGAIKGKLKGLLLAGHDFFLIPSRYEPCGLTDAESLYFGGIPIAHQVGGLNKGLNTILYGPVDPDNQGWALGQAIDRAFELYRHPRQFHLRQMEAMKEDFSVEKNFAKFLLNNRIETYVRLIIVLDRDVVHGLITGAQARTFLRKTLDARAADRDPLADALAKLSQGRRTPLMDELVEEYRLKNVSFEHVRLGKVRSKSAQPFEAVQGWHVVERGEVGLPVVAYFRVLAPSSSARYYLVGDFNHWGDASDIVLEQYRLKRAGHSDYLESMPLSLRHGDEYLILKRETGKVDLRLTDLANVAFSTPGLLKKMGKPIHQQKHSVFWDIDGPGRYLPKARRQDARTLRGGGIMVETDLAGLVRKWDHHGQIGPKEEIETYSFVADSGIIPFLASRGINRIKFLPLGEHVNREGWQWTYQNFPFAIDCFKGTPDDFARMVDVFNQNHIAVIMDEVTGHFPGRELEPAGMHAYTRDDGSSVYGHGYPTQWGTVPYDDSNPEVVRFKNDAVLFHIAKYNVSGVRIDNAHGGPAGDGIATRPGGEAYLKKMNQELHDLDPGLYTNSEAFGRIWEMTASTDHPDGLGFNATNHGYLQRWIELNFWVHPDEMDFDFLRQAITQPFQDQQSARTTYLTNHDMADNGSSFPANILESRNIAPHEIAARTKAFGVLTMVIGSDYQLMLQAELGQTGYFADATVDWSLLQQPRSQKLFSFWKKMDRLFAVHPAFNLRHNQVSPIIQMDAQNQVIAFWRADPRTRKGLLIVINLGGKTFGESYRIAVPHEGYYRLLLDSESSEFGGESVLPQQIGTHPDFNRAWTKSLILPRLRPHQVVVLGTQ